MIHLYKSSSHTPLEGEKQHSESITESEIMRGGIPESTAGEEMSEAGGADSDHHKGRSAIRA